METEAMNIKDASSVAVQASRGSVRRRRRPAAERQAADSHILDYQDLPEYLKDNEFIKGGYRSPDMPFKKTLLSLFNIHNETGNVWTHLLGFILFVVLTGYVMYAPPVPLAVGKAHIEQLWPMVQTRLSSIAEAVHLPRLPDLHLSENLHSLQDRLHHGVDSLRHGVDSLVHEVQEEVHHAAQLLQEGMHSLLKGGGENASASRAHHVSESVNGVVREALSEVLVWPVPRWPVFVFMAGAMVCLLLSATCHLFGCCSRHVAQIIWRFDYAGIAILIVASYYPPVYYGFLCRPVWQVVYLASITIMGLGAVAVSLLEVFQQPKWRPTRAGLFVVLGGLGVVPLVHASWAHGDVGAVRTATRLDVLMGVLYLLGALVYATRVPERWLPGRFDTWLHGHQIFHILIVAAAFVHYRAVMLLLHWRDASGGCMAPVRGPWFADMAQALQHLRESGHDLLHVDQLWERLRAHAFEYLGLGPAGEALGHGAAAGGAPAGGAPAF